MHMSRCFALINMTAGWLAYLQGSKDPEVSRAGWSVDYLVGKVAELVAAARELIRSGGIEVAVFKAHRMVDQLFLVWAGPLLPGQVPFHNAGSSRPAT